MSANGFKIVYKGGEGEIVEKKSRFIAYVKPVDTEEEAAAFIEEIKKKNWDARHNCAAAVIGKNNEFTRCNDDGEPAGTAGKPMLEVLLGEGVHNVAVVVTRYFGGILLGIGISLIIVFFVGKKMLAKEMEAEAKSLEQK